MFRKLHSIQLAKNATGNRGIQQDPDPSDFGSGPDPPNPLDMDPVHPYACPEVSNASSFLLHFLHGISVMFLKTKYVKYLPTN